MQSQMQTNLHSLNRNKQFHKKSTAPTSSLYDQFDEEVKNAHSLLKDEAMYLTNAIF